MVDWRSAAVWQLILKLLGLELKDGPAPSLPNLPSESKANSAPEPSVPVAPKKKERPAIEKLVEIALSQVGVKEVGGNNKGAKIREYQTATSLKPAAWPWCAAFTSWIIREWLKDPEVVKWLNLKLLTPEKWRPKTAAAFGYIEWAKSRPATTKILTEKAKPQVGDLVVFDFSHIGIVVKVGEKNFQCVEGNTNGRGTRDSKSGDGVWLKTRTSSLVRNYIRINPSKVQ
jgi:hypothetical protein